MDDIKTLAVLGAEGRIRELEHEITQLREFIAGIRGEKVGGKKLHWTKRPEYQAKLAAAHRKARATVKAQATPTL